MAPDIALDSIPEFRGGEKLQILDPMCGSGTVLDAALIRGHDAVGIDIDPLAVMMSRLTVDPHDFADLGDVATILAAEAASSSITYPWADDETIAFVNYWFAPQQRDQLAQLTGLINALDEDHLRLALQLAISRIIVTKSPAASLAADTSHSRPHRVKTESEYDVFTGFRRSAIQLQRMLVARTHRGFGRVTRGDARLISSVDASTVDMVVTSPPYLNALDYLRGHKLALVWFGFSIAQIREMRRNSIGAERRPDGDLNSAAARIVETIVEQATSPAELPMGTVQRFAGDMVSFAEEMKRVCKPRARLVLVVGNSTLRGNYIRNDAMAQLALREAGFTDVDRFEREIPPSSRYMAVDSKNASALAKRMRTEIVLTMER